MAKFDVAVIGGGTGGVPAAVAAAHSGAGTLLVERYGFLGGMATGGLVNPYMPYQAGGKTIVRGIFAEMLNRLQEAGGLAENKATFDEEVLKFVLDDL
ncbi:MAG: FAD-dependent oxidoreductase, partial [Planctomycetes bacterium]|nr:FAD-dependent oxidoreductase [Planctomycetota bacterium]